jgi:ribonuclease HI
MKIQAWFDGSCAPVNPGGTAKIGIVIKGDGEIFHSASRVVGTGPAMTNNVAEYAAVNAVMDYLIEEQITGEVTIYGDSLIVIRRLSRGKVSKGLCTPYSQRAVDLKKKLVCKATFVWIPRAENGEADELSRA